jgi:hypothetical protein
MSKLLRYVAVGAAVASLGLASGAQAATSAQANASATILTSLAVAVDAADNTLNFGSIAPGASAVSVVVAPSGALTCPIGVVCSGTVNAPTFNITGAPNATVQVTFANASETLTDASSDTMTASSFLTNLTSDQATLAADGTAAFNVGGSLAVAASQPAGSYTGTLTVNVAYN